MLSLGQHKLSPTSVRYSKENRWSTIECIGKIPSLQNIGQGTENIELEGVIYFHHLNDLNQLKSIKEAKKNQEPSILYQFPLHREQIDNNGKKAILK